MILLRLVVLVTVLVAASAALAQLKPAPPAGTSVVPASDPTAALKELAAQAAAEKWLGLLDRGEYGKAWDECAKLFRDRVARQQWVESLPTTRAAFGAVKGRKVELASYKTSIPGAPDGQYVTVRFRTAFESKENAEEQVTLILEDGLWRPTGYFIR